MELSKPKDGNPESDAINVPINPIKTGGTDTPDSNKGLQDNDSVTDSPKITKPVLGRAQAKKRLMAFANKFTSSPILKPKEKDVNISKVQNTNVFSTKKKTDNTRDSVNDVKDERNRTESSSEFQDSVGDDKKHKKQLKKKVEPKISAIEEIIREESEQRMLLLSVPEKISEAFLKNNRPDRNRNFGRVSQWGRKSQESSYRRPSSFSKSRDFGKFRDRQYSDQRRQSSSNNSRRDRSRSVERREGSFCNDRRRSISPEIDLQVKSEKRFDKSSYKKGDKYRTDRGRNEGHREDDRRDRRNEFYYPSRCDSWVSFKSHGGRIRQRSLSTENYEDTRTDVKFKTAQDYSVHLEQMLMLGSHRLKRSCAIADGKNPDERKSYPPESIRVTKCKGSPILYCENPNVSLLLLKEQLLQMVPPDRCNLIRSITDVISQFRGSDYENKSSNRKWFKKLNDLKVDDKKSHSRKRGSSDKQGKHISVSPMPPVLLPKSKWDSEDESAPLTTENTHKVTVDNIDINPEDLSSCSSVTDEHDYEKDDKVLIKTENTKHEERRKSSKIVILTAAEDSSKITKGQDTIDDERISKEDEFVSKDDEKTEDSTDLGDKLISEYEQFIKIVSNNAAELRNSVERELTEKSPATLTATSDSQSKGSDIKNSDENNELIDTQEGGGVDDKKLFKAEENLPIEKNSKIDNEVEEGIEEEEVKADDSDWENIREEINKIDKAAASSNLMKAEEERRKRHRKKMKIRKKMSSSESSDSSSSSSEVEMEKKKKRRRKKKKKNRDSSSGSSSSESEGSSTEDATEKRKRKRSNKKKRNKKKSRSRKKRVKKEFADSESSVSDDDKLRKKKRRKRETSRHRKSSKRRLKSTDARKIQKLKKVEKIKMLEENSGLSLGKLKSKIVVDVTNLEENLTKEAKFMSQSSDTIKDDKDTEVQVPIVKEERGEEEPREIQNVLGTESNVEPTTSIKDHGTTEATNEDKAEGEEIEGEENTDVKEVADQSDGSSKEKKKKKKIRKKHRSSSTSSSSSISSSSTSHSIDSKSDFRGKKKKKKRRRSGDLSSKLMRKFKKYHSKLSSSLDFDALHFPSLTQLQHRISKNITAMDDWEVDSQDENGIEEFLMKSKEKLPKKQKKIEKEVRYDSKTDTYISVEKKAPRENKKKQTGSVCALRIWEDEEEEGEREAIMLMNKKKDTEVQFKPWEKISEDVVIKQEVIDEEAEPKPVEAPAVTEELKNEEKPTEWVESVSQAEVASVEPTVQEESKKASTWAEPVPDLKEDLEDENLVPVNWEEEEEVEWTTKTIAKDDRSKSEKSRHRTSSESSSDSSDSSTSSSESSDSDRETSRKSRVNRTSQKLKDPLKDGSEETFAETEAMKKLRMSMFAEFAARESRDGFTDQPDSLGSSEIPLMVSRISTLPILLGTKKEDPQFPAGTSGEHAIDSTAEKEELRRGYRDATPRSHSPRSTESRDSKRRYSPERNQDRSRIRNSEERRSVSSHRSGNRNSTRDKGRIDDRDLRSHGIEGNRKYSPLSERDFRENRRSPASWDRPRSRSRSWSRSRSRSPSKRTDRSSWDRQKRPNYPDDRRDRFSRSPARGRSPLARDRGRWSLDRDRGRDRDWSRERRDDRASYDHQDQVRDRYAPRRRGDEAADRDTWRDDDKISREPLDMYVNRPAPDEIDDRIYRRNDSLDREILDGPIGTEFDKPRYRSSRELRNHDVDWDRSRESPGSDKFGSRRRQMPESKSRSRLLSPRSRSPVRFNHSRGRSRSRSRSWSKSRSRSRSVSRNRSRSPSLSRSRMIRAGIKPLDRTSRSRLSRSLSPQRRSPVRPDEDRYRRSPSQECGKRIETIIHPSGVPLEDSLSIGEPSEANMPPAPAQFEYNYYQGSNLTYPPRVDTANPSPGSPKRLSLDDRLELELGIKKSHEMPLPPPPVPLPYGHPKYGQPMLPYPGGVMPPGAPTVGVPPPIGGIIGASSTSLAPPVPVGQPPGPIPPPGYHCPPRVVPPVTHGSPVPSGFNRQLPTVVQVGNVLQVVPGDFSSTQLPPPIHHGVPPPNLPGPSTAPGSNNSNRVVRVGNVLQVVPSTALDWSGRPPLPSGQQTMPMNAAHLGIRPAAPIAPYPVAPVIRPPIQSVPAVPAPVPPRPPVKSVAPLPIAALPKLEPPKAPPVIQPVYNYEAIMEARRKEREERKQVRAEKRLEKKRRKMERLKRRAKRALVKNDAKVDDVKSEIIEENEPQPSSSKDDSEAEIIAETTDVISEDLSNAALEISEQSEQVEQTTPPEVEEDDDDEEGDVEEDDEDIEFGNEEDAEDEVSKAMNTISQQVEADIIKLAENPDAETTTIDFKVAIPLPSPPKRGILVPPGFWEERFIHDQSDEEKEMPFEAVIIDDSNLTESKVPTNGDAGDNQNEINVAGENDNDKEKKMKTLRQRRARKSVQFADGIKPGEGTSPSGCEGDLPSPPPPIPISATDALQEQLKRTRVRKSRKKAKRIKPLKIKKKVKVKIIKLKKPKVTPLQAMMMDDSDEMDGRSPPPPPPGSPPPPHLWPSYLAAYSATLRPADSVSPGNGNQAPPPPTPLPLLVPPPPLNYTIQPFSK